MLSIPVVHVGYACEARTQRIPDVLEPDQAPAARLGTPRHLEDTILYEEAHDTIEVMGVESIQNCFERA